MRLVAAIWMAVAAAWPAAAETFRDTTVEMVAVQDFDLNRYLGRWYEIARFPNRFEKGCYGVTADYGLLGDGRVSVLNTCRTGDLNGPIRTAEGKAKVKGPGRLSVNFVRWLPFARGDYWVLYVDPDYTVAAVGAPKGKTGWILARDPRIDADDRARAEAALRANGYDINRLIDVPQGGR